MSKLTQDLSFVEAWMHAAVKTSEKSANNHDTDKWIFSLGFEAGQKAIAPLSYSAEEMQVVKQQNIDLLITLENRVPKDAKSLLVALEQLGIRLDDEQQQLRWAK